MSEIVLKESEQAIIDRYKTPIIVRPNGTKISFFRWTANDFKHIREMSREDLLDEYFSQYLLFHLGTYSVSDFQYTEMLWNEITERGISVDDSDFKNKKEWYDETTKSSE